MKNKNKTKTTSKQILPKIIADPWTCTKCESLNTDNECYYCERLEREEDERKENWYGE